MAAVGGRHTRWCRQRPRGRLALRGPLSAHQVGWLLDQVQRHQAVASLGKRQQQHGRRDDLRAPAGLGGGRGARPRGGPRPGRLHHGPLAGGVVPRGEPPAARLKQVKARGHARCGRRRHGAPPRRVSHRSLRCGWRCARPAPTLTGKEVGAARRPPQQRDGRQARRQLPAHAGDTGKPRPQCTGTICAHPWRGGGCLQARVHAPGCWRRPPRPTRRCPACRGSWRPAAARRGSTPGPRTCAARA